MGYIIRDYLVDNTKKLAEQKPETYYEGADGFIKVEAEYCKPYKRLCNAIKKVLKETEYKENTNFVRIDDRTYTYIEHGKWSHLVNIIEV